MIFLRIRVPVVELILQINLTGKFMIPALSDMHVHLEGEAWNLIYGEKNSFTTDQINFSN